MKRNLYFALGDSITAGYGAGHKAFTFVHQVSEHLRRKSSINQTLVLARNGWTTNDLWNAALQVDNAVWDHTRVLTLIVGGNDLRRLLRRLYLPLPGNRITDQLVYQAVQDFESNMRSLCSFIKQLNIPQVVVCTMYNPAPNFPLAVEAIAALNEKIRIIAKQHQFLVADLYTGFRTREPEYIEWYRTGRSQDLVSPFRRPIHPNSSGHSRIAELIIAVLRRSNASPSRKRAKPKKRPKMRVSLAKQQKS